MAEPYLQSQLPMARRACLIPVSNRLFNQPKNHVRKCAGLVFGHRFEPVFHIWRNGYLKSSFSGHLNLQYVDTTPKHLTTRTHISLSRFESRFRMHEQSSGSGLVFMKSRPMGTV